MLYRPLPIAGVLEIHLVVTEFQTKIWNRPVETFYYFFLLHHLKAPTKGRCNLWDSWHPSTAWRSSQTVRSQHLQASILSMCWKELRNKRCVGFTGCLFTLNRPMFCFLSPPLSPRIWGYLAQRLQRSSLHPSSEEPYPKNQQQRQAILQQQNGQSHFPTELCLLARFPSV